jgi:hypothetical protein
MLHCPFRVRRFYNPILRPPTLTPVSLAATVGHCEYNQILCTRQQRALRPPNYSPNDTSFTILVLSAYNQFYFTCCKAATATARAACVFSLGTSRGTNIEKRLSNFYSFPLLNSREFKNAV